MRFGCNFGLCRFDSIELVPKLLVKIKYTILPFSSIQSELTSIANYTFNTNNGANEKIF